MSFTSINILNNNHQFKYVIEYINNEEYIDNSYYYTVGDNIINFYEKNTDCWLKNNNVLTKTNIDPSNIHDNNIPNPINISSINIYFPEYSVETYKRGIKYALTINTWINNKIIYLGTYILDRSNAEAADSVKTFYNNKYFEKINVKFIDPWFLNYSEDWKDWREENCDSIIVDKYELNNNGSIINFTLHPVIEDNDLYITHDDYIGGQNSINLKDNIKNNLKYNISINYTDSGICFDGKVSFNNSYDQSIEGLKEYLKETYDVEGLTTQFDFYIQDNADVYDYIAIENEDIHCRLDKPLLNNRIDEEGKDYKKYTSWDEYIDGMYINSIFSIVDKNNEALISIMSNEIPITQEVYKYFIFAEKNSLELVKLSSIDMNIININAVNKIVKNTIQLDRPKDYKSNITKPVYYRVRDISNIVIHPEVTENICINLDKYKYLVDQFILKVEGVNFTETSRNTNGIVFKIVGNSLPNKNQSGTYYILNQDSELITTGKYTYEI